MILSILFAALIVGFLRFTYGRGFQHLFPQYKLYFNKSTITILIALAGYILGNVLFKDISRASYVSLIITLIFLIDGWIGTGGKHQAQHGKAQKVPEFAPLDWLLVKLGFRKDTDNNSYGIAFCTGVGILQGALVSLALGSFLSVLILALQGVLFFWLTFLTKSDRSDDWGHAEIAFGILVVLAVSLPIYFGLSYEILLP